MNEPVQQNEKRRRLCARADRALLRLGLLGKQNWTGINTVFIVSTGRTGTKFFARFFAGIKGIHAVHEPRPNLLKYALAYAQGKRSFDDASKFLEWSRRAAAKDTRRRACSTYIESNNRLFSLLKPLRTVFPDARIVHIVRDGRDYVKSGMARRWYTKRDYKKREHAHMFPGDPYLSEWDTMTRFEKICWRWQKKDGFITRDFDDIDGPKLRVTFEDIFNDPERKGLYEITRFLGIEDSITSKQVEQIGDRQINANTAFEERIDSWSDWDDRLRMSFDRIAGAHMRLHYEYSSMSGEAAN